MFFLQNKCDIVVVGGGPAGCMAAYTGASQGVRVVLFEKDREIGIPVRCAEAVGMDGLEQVLEQPLPSACIATTIRRFKFVAPDGSVVYPNINMTGFVLNRKIFDLEIARRAADAGATIVPNAYVHGLLFKDNKIRGVQVFREGVSTNIEADIVIAADGVESRVGRWAGLESTLRLKDIETCCQYMVCNIEVETDTCAFYFSQADFPGGYAWVFPKGDQTANIGMGIAGNKSSKKSVSRRLDDFIKKYYPDARIIEKTVGGVPCAPRMKKICTDGILLTGDAAWQSNPISGGGIISGMKAGCQAGLTAAQAILKKDTSYAALKIYEKRWEQTGGRAHRRYYRLKDGIRKLTDEQLNKTAQMLNDIPQDEQTLTKIFQTALMKQPALFIDILKVISPFY
jgi:digeranylgeranylglycerophospholipid reductase